MENLKEVESVLEMKNLYFEKIAFERGETIDVHLTPKFRTSYREIEGTVFEVKLYCTIFAGDRKLLELVLVGIFDNKSSDPEEVKELNELNTVSIMFPYLRSQISLVTAQPNFPSITLPVININALLSSQKENI